MTADAIVSREGARFGPFQLARLMDSVGLGEVYEAEDTRTRQAVMLKLVSQEFASDAMTRARMHREADTVGQLSEAHIVPIREYGDIDGQFYITMRMIDGTSLRALLTDQGRLTPARAVVIVRQIAGALSAAHACGINYHDVRPENILITENYRAYLLDFGMGDAVSDLIGASQTAGGAYNYMAPEWFRNSGGDIGYRADIYALACVLSECLIGIPLYLAGSVDQLMAAQSIGPAPRPSHLRPGYISPALDSVVATGVAQIPAARYSSAEELAAAAHHALTTAEQDEEAALGRQGEDATRLPDTEDFGTNGISSGTEPQIVDVAATHPWSDGTVASPGAWKPSVKESPSGGRSSIPPLHADRRRIHPSAASDLDRRVLTKHSRDKRTLWVICGAVATLVLVVIIVAGIVISRPSSPSPQATKQTVLPYNGVSFRLSPGAVAVDHSGTVYVTNQGMYGRVVTLAAGSSTPIVEQFRGLYEPQDVAVDSTGAI